LLPGAAAPTPKSKDFVGVNCSTAAHLYPQSLTLDYSISNLIGRPVEVNFTGATSFDDYVGRLIGELHRVAPPAEPI
jgi:hypothetical protein